MLQAIRSKANTLIVKILFGVLAITFALWGIGDIFRNWGVDTTVAKVGGKEITAAQLDKVLRSQMAQLSNVLGKDIGMAQAKQLGLVGNALQTMVNTNLIDLEAHRLGLEMGDDGVRQAIITNPDFKGPSGVFDRTRYKQLLAANQLSEPQFEESVRQGLIRGELTNAVVDGLTPTPLLVDTLYRSRAERRTADVVTLTPAAVPAPPTPTAAQLAAFHDAHKDDFRVPEQRTLTLALLRLDDVAATIQVPEDKLKKAYDSHREEFHTPEERQVKQLLLPSKAKADEAETALHGGKTFAAVAKQEASADASTTDLGWVKQSDLPPELAKAAFALPQDKASAPIKSSFGWHILMVTGIKPAAVQSFAAVKKRLEQEIARDQAADAISDIANHIDDAMAAGDSLASVAKKFGLKTEHIASIDAQGRGRDGKPIDLPQPAAAILHAAFATDAGQSSALTELGNNGYFIVHVDNVTPASVEPLSAAHAKAVSLWQAEQKKDALAKLAHAIIDEVKEGKSLKRVAADRKLSVTTTAALQRTGGDAAVPPALVAEIFDAKKGAAVSAASGDNFVVAQVKTIEPADPKKDPGAVKALSEQLTSEMRNDMLHAFDQALRGYFPVEINQSNLDRLL